MNLNPTWNRRTFLTTLGLTTAAASLPAAASPLAATSPRTAQPALPTHVFLSFANHHMPKHGGILTYTVDQGRWQDHLYPAEIFVPDALAAHPTLPILYTASMYQTGKWARRGRVNAFSIDPTENISLERCLRTSHHWLNEISREPLALSATWPGDLAVSPDARSLLVADWQGGHLNLFPLAADGAILPLEHALKQVGNGPDAPARPHAVLFHPGSRLAWATDRGTDRLHLLSLPAAPGDGPLRITRQLSFPSGSGPAHLALHPAGKLLLVSGRNNRTLTVVPVDPDTGEFTSAIAHHPLSANGQGGPLAINPAGDRVYVTTSHPVHHGSDRPQSRSVLHTLRLSSTGRLSLLARTRLTALDQAAQLAFLGGDLLIAGVGGMVTLPLDTRTGVPGDPVHVVPHGSLTGIVLRTA